MARDFQDGQANSTFRWIERIIITTYANETIYTTRTEHKLKNTLQVQTAADSQQSHIFMTQQKYTIRLDLQIKKTYKNSAHVSHPQHFTENSTAQLPHVDRIHSSTAQ